MFIVWGHYQRKREMGRAAEFCRRCQEPRPFQLREHRRVGHIYFIPLSRGKVVGYTGQCETCQYEVNADPTGYAALIADRHAPLDTLIEQTNPALPQRAAQWSSLLARAAEEDITDEERQMLIYDRIAMQLSDIEKRASQAHIDLRTTLAMGAALLIAPLTCGGVMSLSPNNDTMIWLALAATLLPFAWPLWLLITDPRRFVRRKIIPKLANELEPLNPTRDDLAAVLGQLTSRGYKTGKLIKLDHLAAAIESRMNRTQA